jgi:membrane protein DedA with SNARE-associated domain
VALTGIGWLDAVLVALSAHGYLAVFVGGLFENVFIVGGFFPGEALVMGVAFLASKTPGLSPILIWLLSVAGTMAGSNVSYAIGHRGGRPMLEAVARRFPRFEGGIIKSEEYFDIHGPKTVFIARFTAGFKNWVPTLAGAGRMPLPSFETYTLLSAVVYSTGLVIIGYFFGDNMDIIVGWLRRAGVWATVVVVAGVAGYVALRVWRSRVMSEEVSDHVAEAAAEAVEMGGADPTQAPSGDDGE